MTFSWTDGGASVSGWIFQIGSSPGGSNFYYSGVLSGATSTATVVGLPTDSRVLHVRLRYLANSTWNNIDATYTAAELVPTLTNPVSGSTLGSDTVTFDWTSNGAPVTQWIFQIGTNVGLSNVYYGGVVTGSITSATVSGLPTDGSTLFVRLRYLANGAWKNLDVTYVASSSP